MHHPSVIGSGADGERAVRPLGRRWLALALGGAVGLVVLGFGGFTVLRPYLANRQADVALDGALSQARIGDAWQLLVTLDQQRLAILRARELPDTGPRPALESRVLARERQLLDQAVAGGNAVALASMFDLSDAHAPLRDDLSLPAWRAQKLSAFAATVGAIRTQTVDRLTAADGWVLAIAGQMAMDGHPVSSEAADSLRLFSDAYGAGYHDAAYGAAVAARAADQQTEAYRWALRCSETCATREIDLTAFQAKVSAHEIALVQAESKPVIVDHRQAK